ncbi:GntR family transcriptional regulator [Pseudonocardia kongjuensis]|uniref:GntR family transcriptional regulator n=1 Tax=Pseudonocardia kongjuensis TaxID=102227 RepID=A0ABN1Y008_9PSEU
MKPTGSRPGLGPSAVRTAHRDVTERLRDAIVSGVLPAGSRLVQAELAATLEVSVTPVREALRELESQGLVDFDPFRGATVHQVSLAELDEVYEIRRTLIPIAARERVRTITDEEIEEAEAIASAMSLRSDSTRWVEDNRRLHRLLDGTSGQVHLRAIMRRLADISSLYVGLSVTTDPTRRRRAREDHKELIRAYRKRDAALVTAITLRHISDTETVAREALLRSGTH